MEHGELRESVGRAVRGGRIQPCEVDGVRYARVTDDIGRTVRGTVVLGDVRAPDSLRVVPAFPSVGRIFALAAGVRRNLRAAFRAEEKLDGFNVRIARWNGRLLAFTRGGWVCPFTTDRLPDLAALGPVFDDDPDAVLCAEVVGPGNPYMAAPVHLPVEDVALFVFDLMRLDGDGPEPLTVRDELLARHDVPRAPVLGGFDGDGSEGEIARLRDLVLDLDARGAEGMVLKPENAGLRVKYVTPTVNLDDIVADAALVAELPGDFFTGRIVRMVMGVEELGVTRRFRDIEGRLGRALVRDFERSLEQLRSDGTVHQDFSVRLRDPRSADRLLAHLDRSSRRVQVRELARSREGNHTRLVFRKVLLRSTSYLKSLLGGEPIID